MKNILFSLSFILVLLFGILIGSVFSPFSIIDCISHGGWISSNNGNCYVEEAHTGLTFQLNKPYANR